MEGFRFIFAPVKVLVFILSVYLLALCCYPCFEDDCADRGGADATEVQTDAHHETGEKDACTPFCFDDCCAAHIICHTSFIQIPSEYLFDQEPNHHYTVTPIAGILLPVWEPPKI